MPERVPKSRHSSSIAHLITRQGPDTSRSFNKLSGECLVVQSRQVRVADEHRPARQCVEAGDAVHERRLAGTARAHNGGELAAFEKEFTPSG